VLTPNREDLVRPLEYPLVAGQAGILIET